MGCKDRPNDKIVSDDRINNKIQFSETIDSEDNKEGKRNTVVEGSWKLTKVNAPWEIPPSIPEDEIWSFKAEGILNVSNSDSINKTIHFKLKKSTSGFSSDSVWTIDAEFNDSRINGNLEIWKKENSMRLIDQCDDCYSFEFKRLNK